MSERAEEVPCPPRPNEVVETRVSRSSPIGHVRVVYLGPVAPHWEVQSDLRPARGDRRNSGTGSWPAWCCCRRTTRSSGATGSGSSATPSGRTWRSSGTSGFPEDAADSRLASSRSAAEPRAISRVSSGRSVEQADPGQPQARRIDLGRGGQVDLVGPQPGERVLAGPLDHARDEGAAPVHLVLADVEPEEAGEGLLALALLDPVAVPGLAERGRRRREGRGEPRRDVVDVGADARWSARSACSRCCAARG